MARLQDVGEWAAIRAIAREAGMVGPDELGIGDDAAIGHLGAGLAALTTLDMLVEDVHFRRTTIAPEDLGHKALAVNLSDIAAMGGRPRWAVVGLALPPTLELDWLVAFYRGLVALGRAHDTHLVGGDTVRASGGLVISLALVGEAARPLLRSSARPGDVVFMTAPAGLSAAGLWCLEHPEAARALDAADRAAARAAHVRPLPQLAAGQALAATGVRVALMDNSDGLGRSAIGLAEASRVDLVLEAAALPTETATARVAALAGVDPVDWILDGGEDYGLVGCVAPADWPMVAAALAATGCAGYGVGEVTAGEGRAWVRHAGGELRALGEATGFGHFSA